MLSGETVGEGWGEFPAVSYLKCTAGIALFFLWEWLLMKGEEERHTVEYIEERDCSQHMLCYEPNWKLHLTQFLPSGIPRHHYVICSTLILKILHLSDCIKYSDTDTLTGYHCSNERPIMHSGRIEVGGLAGCRTLKQCLRRQTNCCQYWFYKVIIKGSEYLLYLL